MRTISSPSNQLRILTEQLATLKIELGKAFLPIVQVILPILNSFVGKLIQAVQVFGQFMQALFGKSQGSSSGTSDIESSVGSVGDLTTGLEDAEAAAKKAKKSLMGFDELNTLASKTDTDTDTSGTGSIDVPALDTDTSQVEAIPEKIQAIADKIKSVLSGLQDFYNEHKEVILSVIGGIVAGFAAFKTLTFLSEIPAMLTAISGALSVILSPIGLASLAVAGLTAVFLYLWQTNDEFREKMKEIWSNIAQLFTDFWQNTLVPFGEYFVNDFIGPIAEGFQTYLLPVFADVFVGMGEILYSILDLVLSVTSMILEGVKPILDLIQYVFVDCMRIVSEKWNEHGQGLVDGFVTAIDKLKEVAQSIWDNILYPCIVQRLEHLKTFWDEHFSGYIEKFSEFYIKLAEGCLKIWNEVLAPFISWFAETFGPAIVAALNVLDTAFYTFLGAFYDVLGYMYDALSGLIDFIVGVITGDWEQAWNGIVEIFKAIWGAIVTIVTYPIEHICNVTSAAWDFIKELTKALCTAVGDYWQYLTDRLSSLVQFIGDFIKNIWNGIRDFLVNIVKGVADFMSSTWNGIQQVITTVLNTIRDVMSNIWNGISQVISSVLNNIKNIVVTIWNSIRDVINNVLNGIRSTVSSIWNGIRDTISNILNGISNTVSSVWNGIRNTISNVVGGIKTVIQNAFDGVRNVMNNICSWISNTFKYAWSNAWNGVVNIFSRIWDGLTDTVKAPLNFIIDCVNAVIRGLNKIKLPSWAGGYGINISTIPRLAQGGIVDKPTVAQIGEAGPEVVMPLKNTPFVTTLANAVANATAASISAIIPEQSNGSEAAGPIILQVDGVELAKTTVNNINRLSKVTGQCMIRT